MKMPANFLDGIKNNWNLLSMPAGFLASIAAGFMIAPPAGVLQAGQGDAVWNYGVFVITVGLGLIIWPCISYKRLKDRKLWTILAVSALVSTIVAYLLYGASLAAWTCEYAGELRVIGSTLTHHGEDYVKSNPDRVTPSQWVYDHAGEVTEIWHSSEIELRRSLLHAVFVGVLLLISLTIVAVGQLVFISLRPK